MRTEIEHYSSWELKKQLSFSEYEKQYDREIEIVCDNEPIMNAVSHTIVNLEKIIIASNITKYTFYKENGCLTSFICYIATLEGVKILKIIKS